MQACGSCEEGLQGEEEVGPANLGSEEHYCPSITDKSLWTKHYDPSTTVQALLTKHGGPSTTVQALQSKHY